MGTGSLALVTNSSGEQNTAIGTGTLSDNETGNFNTALGSEAGYRSLGNASLFVGYRAGYHETNGNKFYLANNADNAIMYGDFTSRQLLLGVKDPVGYVFKGTRTLNVIGGILTDSIRVAPSGNWADYVFEENYGLLPLNDLENYIKRNKHLPNIPTAELVKKDGINLAEMNVKLLEKIEELTLYLIDQQKQLLSQQKQITALLGRPQSALQ
ncbi:MAG: hypothetical protein EOO88_36640 [Pedobacter sp.]|nr:MAG: hypothetical protein EOO88_36640 [Pedobacter sp.]